MNSAKKSTIQKPLIDHVRELQKHLTWSVAFVALGTGVAYAIHRQLLALLQAPLDQTLYYTSPTGELSFLVKLCVISGIVFSLPFILYNLFKFLEPVVETQTRFSLLRYTAWSFILAYIGIAFAYFASLPASLHFLSNIGEGTIQPIITANEYFNFALSYVAGFAILFQLPLVVLFINRINTLKPGSMMGFQRYVIVGSFVVAAIFTPTPDPFNQLMMALPMIVLYQFSIVLVWIVNRRKKKQVPLPIVENTRKVHITDSNSQPRPILVGKPIIAHALEVESAGFQAAQATNSNTAALKPDLQPSTGANQNLFRQSGQKSNRKSMSDVVRPKIKHRSQSGRLSEKPVLQRDFIPTKRRPLQPTTTSRLPIGNEVYF